MRRLRRSQKIKGVSWASDLSLSQVRLFLSEQSPSHVLGTDHLSEKAAADNEAEEDFPPGFEQIQPENMWRIKLSQMPLIKWKCPRGFEVNNEWEVVAGEESREVEAQSQREMSVLEAIYPQPSSIPPNPFGLLNVEDSTANDRNTPPLVPITPIEEENAMSQPHVSNAAFTSSFGQGNLVDQDLLIKILNNPKMVEQLVSSHNISTIQNNPLISTQYIPPSLRPQTHNSHMIMATPNGHFYPAATQVKPPEFSPMKKATQVRSPEFPPTKKNTNYFKSLIQQHGRERQDGSLTSSEQNLNLVGCRDLKQRILKPCTYYNSSRGCRKGVNCTYQHDMLSENRVHGFPGVHNAKKLKLGCEIVGR